MIKIQFEQLVEDYYYDRLDAESREAFQTRMIVDTVFADQVDRYVEALNVLNLHRNISLKKRFMQQENQRRQMAVWKKVARFAALILLTIGIPLTFLNYLSKDKTQAALTDNIETFSSSEEIVEWIVEVVYEWDEVLSSSSFSSESYEEIMSHYSVNEESDCSGFQELYDYVMTGGVPLNDVSPEIWNTFSAIFATNSDSVINLLQFMLDEREENEASKKKLSESFGR